MNYITAFNKESTMPVLQSQLSLLYIDGIINSGTLWI